LAASYGIDRSSDSAPGKDQLECALCKALALDKEEFQPSRYRYHGRRQIAATCNNYYYDVVNIIGAKGDGRERSERSQLIFAGCREQAQKDENYKTNWAMALKTWLLGLKDLWQ
jgi:hypothetical protein